MQGIIIILKKRGILGGMQGIIYMTGAVVNVVQIGISGDWPARPCVDQVAGPASAVWPSPSNAKSGSGYHEMKQKAQMPNWVRELFSQLHRLTSYLIWFIQLSYGLSWLVSKSSQFWLLRKSSFAMVTRLITLTWHVICPYNLAGFRKTYIHSRGPLADPQ